MSDTSVIEKTDTQIDVQLPKQYKVILHNDDTTTFEFVIMVLMQIFHKTMDDAIEITKEVHINGQGIAGSPYTREIAEEKTLEAKLFSEANGFSLMTTFEEI